ncbi:MAG: hypothetical protein H3Z51_03530 [archaeon]|nr:hypothetical protein [archaeon]
MNLDDIIEDFRKQNPRFDPLQHYEVIKKFVEEKEHLSLEDLDRLEFATIFDNVWCREYEDKDCEGCPVHEYEKGWGSCIGVSGGHHPFYEKIDYVWYCITALKNHDEEVSKRDLLNAVNDVIRYLKIVTRKTAKNP